MRYRRRIRWPKLRPVAERRYAWTLDYFRLLDRTGGPRTWVPLAWLAHHAPIRGGVEAIRAAGVAVIGERVAVPLIWWRAVATIDRPAESRGRSQRAPARGPIRSGKTERLTRSNG